MKKKKKGFIKRIFKAHPDNIGHICKILGKDRHPSETSYENINSGERYLILSGGLGWPAQDGSSDGYGVIIGVRKTNPITFVALAETTASTPIELMDALIELRKDWGFRVSGDLLRLWYGDPERFPDWSAKHVELTKKNPDHGFIIRHFYDFHQPNAFEIWLQTLRAVTRPGKSRVFTKDCPILRRALFDVPKKILKKPLADFPIISVFAASIHSIIKELPWQEYVERKRLIGTMPDPIFDDATEQEALIKELFGFEQDDDDDGDPSEPGSTMPGG